MLEKKGQFFSTMKRTILKPVNLKSILYTGAAHPLVH